MENNLGENYLDFNCLVTVCAQCGYRFMRGDDALRVRQTGDIIHRECYMDYTDDNVNELTESVDFQEGI